MLAYGLFCSTLACPAVPQVPLDPTIDDIAGDEALPPRLPSQKVLAGSNTSSSATALYFAMSSHVVVLTADMRRATVKVTPSTYLTDVLQEACKKLNVSSDKFLLRLVLPDSRRIHITDFWNRSANNKAVDLSLTYRTSGLSPGAKLNLVQKSKTPSAIQVALQLPQPEAKEIPGGRLIDKFPSDLTLWQLLRQFESGKASNGRNINITARGIAQMSEGASGSGQLYYETPVLNIMNRELSTFVDFQKTLSQLGYNSGSVLIRLSYRKTDKVFHEAVEEIRTYFQEDDKQHDDTPQSSAAQEERAVEAPATDAGGDTPMSDTQPEHTEAAAKDPQAPVPSEPAQSATEPSVARENGAPPVSDDPYTPAHVFLAPTSSTPSAALAPYSEPDTAPSIAQAQQHQHRLQESSKNKRLLSDKELAEKAAAEEAKMASITSILVRVRFPDNTTTEWAVTPEKTGAFLYEAVRRVMVHRDQPFRLVIPPGIKQVIKDDDNQKNSLIKAYKLRGATLVNFMWDDSVPTEIRKQQPFLQDAVAKQGEAVKIPDVPQVPDEEPSAPAAVAEPKKEDKKGLGGLKKPKWMQLGKK